MNMLETLVSGGAFFEGPRWHDGRLWVSDFWRHEVYAVSPSGDTETVASVPGSPSGLGWLPDGSLLVVSMTDNKLLRVHEGETTLYADLSPEGQVGWMSNDMVVDAQGRAYIGTIDFTGQIPLTDLRRVDPDGAVTVVANDMAFPNGPAITPDGKTLIVAESWAQRLTAFTLEPDGALTDRRIWADLAGISPDGIALDSSGAVWVADAGGNRAVRVQEGGHLLDEISTGDLGVFACALGGNTLYLCTAPTYDPAEAAKNHRAQILTTHVPTPALP
ncbi:SMP-30/gluconolactonase/LRE family protein [Nonomuraea sp. NPDC050536]|uniref:SMP-30/gluconolactonase/LRE family protein n=1 Tax=Nonomuraea sp. NPDC050536 TaxID=3364366 RepID=UPI0037C551C2